MKAITITIVTKAMKIKNIDTYNINNHTNHGYIYSNNKIKIIYKNKNIIKIYCIIYYYFYLLRTLWFIDTSNV